MGKQPPLWQGFRTQPFFGPPGLQDGEDGVTVLDGWTYGMGGGAITSITADDGSRWAYEHDANSRLTKAERYDINGTTLLHRYSYTYDDGDNLLTKAVYDAGADSTTSTVFAYGDANLLASQSVGGTTVSFAYDDWGRMTSKSDGTYSATYAYRYGDKLYSVTSDFPSEGNATYQYDGAGKRRQKTAGGTTTKYRFDLGWNVLNEEDGSGNLTRTHVIDSPMAKVAEVLADVAGTNPATGAYRYYFSDHLGSTRALYDGSKSALGSYEYTPHGEVYASSGSVAIEGLAAAFTGKPWDAAAQMYYFPYRWYSSSAARWITRDPLGMVDGPNMYPYLRGKPVNGADPLGLWLGKLICDWFGLFCDDKGQVENAIDTACDMVTEACEIPAGGIVVEIAESSPEIIDGILIVDERACDVWDMINDPDYIPEYDGHR